MKITLPRFPVGVYELKRPGNDLYLLCIKNANDPRDDDGIRGRKMSL